MGEERGRRRRSAAQPRETLEDRWLLEAQTARNLEAMLAEQSGELEAAIALYECNVGEGFAGDLPYGRLVAIYEKRGSLDDAERVLRRAIEVIEGSQRRTPQDRRATVRVFKNRLRMLLKRQAAAARARATPRAEARLLEDVDARQRVNDQDQQGSAQRGDKHAGAVDVEDVEPEQHRGDEPPEHGAEHAGGDVAQERAPAAAQQPAAHQPTN